MSGAKFKVGDRVKSTPTVVPARFANLSGSVVSAGDGGVMIVPDGEDDQVRFSEDELISLSERRDATDPNHYKFGDVEVRQISGYLTGFGAQALQYVARATRMDGQNKGDAVEDLRKAVRFIEWEIERLEAE